MSALEEHHDDIATGEAAEVPGPVTVDHDEVAASLSPHGPAALAYFGALRQMLGATALTEVPATLVAADATHRAVWIAAATAQDPSAALALLSPWLETAMALPAGQADIEHDVWIKALAVASVRNSLLDALHRRSGETGPLGAAVVADLTTRATDAASELWSAGVDPFDANPALAIRDCYPNAWAALGTLGLLWASDQTSAAFIPTETEALVSLSVDCSQASAGIGASEAFDVATWRSWVTTQEGDAVTASGWVELGRSYNRLFRALEWAITRRRDLLTVNALITPGTVHQRAGLLEVDSDAVALQLADPSGLDGPHAQAAAAFSARPGHSPLDRDSDPSQAGSLPGRNDLCWCSSGRKFKHCCLLPAPGPVWF